MEQNRYLFDVRQHLFDVDFNTFFNTFVKEKKSIEKNNPFEKGYVGFRCYVSPSVCRTFYGKIGEIQAGNFLKALDSVLSNIDDISLNFISLSKVISLEGNLSGTSTLSSMEWNEGFLDGIDYTKDGKSRRFSKESKVYQRFAEKLNQSKSL